MRVLEQIPSAWVPSRDPQSARTRVGHYGRVTRAMVSVVRLVWLVCMRVPAALLERVLRLHQWEVRQLLSWWVFLSYSSVYVALTYLKVSTGTGSSATSTTTTTSKATSTSTTTTSKTTSTSTTSTVKSTTTTTKSTSSATPTGRAVFAHYMVSQMQSRSLV